MPDLSRLSDAIIDGDDKLAIQITREALDEAVDPSQLINQWMIPVMDEVGRRFEAQEFFIPEIMLAGEALSGVVEVMAPYLEEVGGQEVKGKIVIGVVKGDLHEIGKNIVKLILETNGFVVKDLG